MSNITANYYTISNTDGRRGKAWDARYEDQDRALHALCLAMGWSDVCTSDSYAISDTDSAISCYATQEECDADETGAYAARVVEHGAGL